MQRQCAACAAGRSCIGGGCAHGPEEEEEQQALPVQPRLVVGASDDPWEREADAVARATLVPAASRPPAVTPVPPARAGGGVLEPPGAGSPLPAAVRARVEPVLGADLGHVRVHAGPGAERTASRLGARAFAHRGHVWLGPGESAHDVGLMAHEAAHVVQQSAGDTSVRRVALGAADPVPASSPACTPAAVAAARDEVVELKGTGRFTPSSDLADMIECAEPAALGVRVRFGALASGILYVRRVGARRQPSDPSRDPGDAGVCPGCHGAPTPRWRGAGAAGWEGEGGASGGGGASSSWARTAANTLYETVDEHAFIDLTHPAFPGAGAGAPPRMYLTIRDSVVTGSIGFFPWDRLPYHAVGAWERTYTLERLLGWRGLSGVEAAD
ncbi:MAG TPA: DUF4157 domain-containing protein, partial [Longimicrobium sp.]|nr:DUF4157 domain-containing protein [Longimicrobium sp.]